MMNNSSAQPMHYDDYGFDLQQDFSLFLAEAKEHGHESNSKLKSSSVYPEEEGSKKKGPEKVRKGKKSWKSSLVSWWKLDKKSKDKEETNKNSIAKVSEKRQGHVSGPILNSYKGYDGKQKNPFSGPLITSLFKPTKRSEENEIPYMSLHQQNSPHPVQNYGPLYVVT